MALLVSLQQVQGLKIQELEGVELRLVSVQQQVQEQERVQAQVHLLGQQTELGVVQVLLVGQSLVALQRIFEKRKP